MYILKQLTPLFEGIPKMEESREKQLIKEINQIIEFNETFPTQKACSFLKVLPPTKIDNDKLFFYKEFWEAIQYFKTYTDNWGESFVSPEYYFIYNYLYHFKNHSHKISTDCITLEQSNFILKKYLETDKIKINSKSDYWISSYSINLKSFADCMYGYDSECNKKGKDEFIEYWDAKIKKVILEKDESFIKYLDEEYLNEKFYELKLSATEEELALLKEKYPERFVIDTSDSRKENTIPLEFFNKSLSKEKRKEVLKKVFLQKNFNLYLDQICKNKDFEALDLLCETTITENGRIKNKEKSIAEFFQRVFFTSGCHSGRFSFRHWYKSFDEKEKKNFLDTFRKNKILENMNYIINAACKRYVDDYDYIDDLVSCFNELTSGLTSEEKISCFVNYIQNKEYPDIHKLEPLKTIESLKRILFLGNKDFLSNLILEINNKEEKLPNNNPLLQLVAGTDLSVLLNSFIVASESYKEISKILENYIDIFEKPLKEFFIGKDSRYKFGIKNVAEGIDRVFYFTIFKMPDIVFKKIFDVSDSRLQPESDRTDNLGIFLGEHEYQTQSLISKFKEINDKYLKIVFPNDERKQFFFNSIYYSASDEMKRDEVFQYFMNGITMNNSKESFNYSSSRTNNFITELYVCNSKYYNKASRENRVSSLYMFDAAINNLKEASLKLFPENKEIPEWCDNTIEALELLECI